MNRYYLLVPIVLLLLFGGVFWRHNQTAAHEAAQRAAEIARADEAARMQKTDTEQKAREDAAQRAAAREAEERQKEEARRVKWEADTARIAADTARHAAQAAENARQIAALEKQLADLRVEKETRNREAFAAAHEVESLSIKRRNAELEIQRVTQIVARRAAASRAIITPAAP
ncbi:hypothetical protein Ga0100231_022970 [Opitutaceae bacterium TAV4]|nr:hypothetical protein Ga0100231_022970 [Opitutaceae bacterium TAV4]RRK00709.1 hypothetical protein Ga0100230_023225 [Opitutaceae bacterium TAV3]